MQAHWFLLKKLYCICCKLFPLFWKQKGEILNNIIATVFYAITMNVDWIFQSLGLLKLTKTRNKTNKHFCYFKGELK